MSTAATDSSPTADRVDRRAASLASSFAMHTLDDAYGTQSIAPRLAPAWWRGGFVAPLSDLGMLSVDGEEAAKFLHGQLTNDVEHLSDTQARHFGYCTAKGRMLGSFLGWRDANAIRLATARPLAESLRKRLSMFVLRAKVKVTDSSGEFTLFGLGGSDAAAALESLGIAPPEPMRVTHFETLAAIGVEPVEVEGGTLRRWILAVPALELERVAVALRGSLVAVGSEQWRWTEVLAGIARIVPATSESFVPQMLNFELVGGVSFTKGCYPGQEIVARSHYLGKLKRRMYAGHVEGDSPAPAADVFDPSGAEACGQIVMAAASPSGGADLLFECKTASAQLGGLRVGDAPLTVGRLPYTIPG